MYMQEALEIVCRKRKLANPKDYALILNDLNILIYLDRTVASLEGKRELTLVKRSMLPQMGIEPETRAMRTTDPNGLCGVSPACGTADCVCILASIFKRISDVPEHAAGTDYTAAYKVSLSIPCSDINFTDIDENTAVHNIPQNAYAGSPGTHTSDRRCLHSCESFCSRMDYDLINGPRKDHAFCKQGQGGL